MSHTEALRIRVQQIKEAYRLTYREIEAETGISNPTIWRVCHGGAIEYENGKRLEEWLDNFKEPKKIKVKGVEYVELVKKTPSGRSER